MLYRLIRDVDRKECPWLDRDFRAGEVFQSYEGYTYGCISDNGVACSWDGKEPFFELPADALDR